MAYENRFVQIPDVWWCSNAHSDANTYANPNSDAYSNTDSYAHSDTDSNAGASAERAQQSSGNAGIHDSSQPVVDG